MQRTPLLLATLAIGSGCGLVETAPGSASWRTLYTLDNDVPEGIEDVFATCMGGRFEIDPESSLVSFYDGTCDTSGMTDEGDIIAGLTSVDVDMGGAIAPASMDPLLQGVLDAGTYSGCAITVDTDLAWQALSLANLRSTWTTHGGLPALEVSLTGTEPTYDYYEGELEWNMPLVAGDLEGDIACRSWLNQRVANTFFSGALPSGHHTIRLTDVEMTIWFEIDVRDVDDVVVTPVASVTYDALTIAPALHQKVYNQTGTSSFQELIEVTGGVDIDDVVRDMETNLEVALGGMADLLEAALENEMAAEQGVCDVRVDADGFTVDATADVYCSRLVAWPRF